MSETGSVIGKDEPRATKARATFYGTHFHKVSGRNQVALPRNMKREIDEAGEDQLLLMRWQNESYLRLYPKSVFDKKLDEVKQNREVPEQEKATLVDFMARSAEPVEPDSQGRFVLPAKWIDALNIREEVAFCGGFTFIKIWPAELQREAERAEAEKLNNVGASLTNILNG
jgi:MraZ protein